MFQRRFNGENEKVLIIRKKGCCNAVPTVRKKGFVAKKKVVSTLKKRDISTVSTLRKTLFSTVKKKDV